MDLPESVVDFLDQACLLDNDVLPQRYPTPAGWETIQIGFRVDEVGVDLCDGRSGWRSPWWVIGLNADQAPFFIDLDEEPDFPVYFAYPGCSSWQPIHVAECLMDFLELLDRLQDLEADPQRAIAWLQRHVDCDNELWADVCSAYAGEMERPSRPAAVVEELTEDHFGHLAVTDFGEQPAVIMAGLGRLMGLDSEETPVGAMAD
ncbi:MAG: hypothetical protein LBL92_02290 [Propionibacteriaceae bacterium]|nr:hypothetical protein [Propionibacteriaceae bacterium]